MGVELREALPRKTEPVVFSQQAYFAGWATTRALSDCQ